MEIEKYKTEIDILTEILGRIYAKVEWRKIKTKNPHEFFRDRLKVASNEHSIPSLIETLCKKLNMSIPNTITSEMIERLDANSKVVFELLNNWTEYFTLKASEKAKTLKLK